MGIYHIFIGPHETYLIKSEENIGTKISFLLSKTSIIEKDQILINDYIQ